MKHKVFFDAQCPLCSNAKKVIKTLDWCSKIEWIPVQYIEQTPYKFLKTKGGICTTAFTW
ncbi:DCC1-like thiol-disulfide oxidoreductase family protein [Falsibacillus pallidus]|uniref:DCC1-like thiol-disulfide oxidoreductase family protein n=1 Tax=Falsibacillus pallidus TaxID=493781 RepID=UPI003D97FE8C